jgi:hypothetical protein
MMLRDFQWFARVGPLVIALLTCSTHVHGDSLPPGLEGVGRS